MSMEPEAWREQLTEEQRASNVFTNVKDLPDLFNQFQHAQSAMGSSIRVPSGEASAGDRQAFYEKLQNAAPDLVRKPQPDDEDSMNQFWSSMGKPEKPDDYPVPEGMTPEQSQFMRDSAFEANMTAAQYRKFSEKFAGQAAVETEQAQFKARGELEELYGEWGVAKDQKMSAIKMLAAQLGMPEDLKESLEGDTPNPSVLKFMNIVADKIGSEGSQLQQQVGNNSNSVMTPYEAEMQINEIMNNPDYMDAGAPSHNMLVRRVVELQSYVDPDAATSLSSQRVGGSSRKFNDTIFG